MRIMKCKTSSLTFTFMDPQKLEWINCKGLKAIEALPKGLMVAFPVRHKLHLGNVVLVNHSKRPYLASLLILS